MHPEHQELHHLSLSGIKRTELLDVQKGHLASDGVSVTVDTS